MLSSAGYVGRVRLSHRLHTASLHRPPRTAICPMTPVPLESFTVLSRQSLRGVLRTFRQGQQSHCAGAFDALAPQAPVWAHAAASAVEALRANPPVRTDAAAAAVDALASLTLVWTDTAASTVFTTAAHAIMLADAAATTKLAPSSYAVVLADPASRTFAALPSLVIAHLVARFLASALHGLLKQ